ncbi:MAG: ferredoxin family protein [Candidatus Atribacteria bacterium]|nr:ferredoxin family protein [Candidatus Atribacteria bacterium]
MVKDLSQTKWHGIPRQEVPWYPIVNTDACIGCELCYVTCGREVYEIVLVDERYRKSHVERPYNCMVGCSTCATVCPTEAISFPSRDIIWKLEREHKIFKIIHTEAEEKREKAEAMTARQKAEEQISNTSTRVKVRIAGVFGEKQFLVHLQNLMKDRPFDIVNLHLHVPTVKGLLENTPAYMDFEVTSTTQEDVSSFINELRTFVTKNNLVWVEQG